MIYSCNYDDSFEPEPKQVFPVSNITLGKKLENPYSVKNMRKAYENIKAQNLKNRTSSENVDIVATHLYVKFIPKTENELDIVKRDSTLVLYDYPLDYEIGKGDVYRDPNVPKSQPTPQYCAVDINYQFTSEVEYEIIEELYIPDEDSDENKASRSLGLSQNFIDQLVDEALIITGNLDEEASKNSINARRTSWRPAGTIKVWDDSLGTSRRVIEYKTSKSYDYSTCGRGGLPCPTVTTTRVPVYGTMTGSYQPLEGVEVRARRWFTTHRGIANSSGYYTCDGTFKRPANYSIDWERYDFALRDGWLNGATYNGPQKRGGWNLNLRNDKQAYYATIFAAAHHYYYKDIKGLRRPPQNSFWKTQIKIKAFLQEGGDCGESKTSTGCHTAFWKAFGIYSPIRIYSYQRSAMKTYATTIHELAHASHYNMSHWHFKNTPDHEKRIKESWARGVQWELTRMKYLNYRGGLIGKLYTQVVVDMIDPHPPIDPATNKPRDINNGSEKLDVDNVTGYTIRQIEDALNEKRSWTDWRNSIINKYDNGTEENLDELFDYWAND